MSSRPDLCERISGFRFQMGRPAFARPCFARWLHRPHRRCPHLSPPGLPAGSRQRTERPAAWEPRPLNLTPLRPGGGLRAKLESGEPGLLFALAELHHLAAERLRRNVTPWEPRDARDYDLASACYAYLYLFGDTRHAPDAFDDRFREACDLYNVSLGWALTARRATNSAAILAGGMRRFPLSHQMGEGRGEGPHAGQIEIDLSQPGFPWPLEDFDQFLLADHFLVRGMSVRNRQRGLGAPSLP